MKKTKLLPVVLLLGVLLAMTLFAVTASAATVSVGDTPYDTLDAALASVPENGTAVITLGEGEFTLTDPFIFSDSKQITIVGAGDALTTVTTSQATAFQLQGEGAALTLKDMTLHVAGNRPIRMVDADNLSLTAENVAVETGSGGVLVYAKGCWTKTGNVADGLQIALTNVFFEDSSAPAGIYVQAFTGMDLSLTNCEIRTENGRTLNTNDDTSGTISISGTTLVGFTPVYMHSRNMNVTVDDSWIKSYNAYSGSVNDTTVLQILGCSNANMSVGTGVEFGYNNTITVTNSVLEAETVAGEIAAIATDTYGAKSNTIRLEDCEIMTSGTLTEEKGGGELTPLYASSDASNTLVIKGLTYGSKTIAEELYMDMSVVPEDYTQTILLDLIPVAKIGSTAYGTLEDAITAAQAGDTITLLGDFTDPNAAEAGVVYDIAGVTLDLNGYTYTVNNFGCIFEGTGATIKNGKIVCADGGSYALFVGDEGTTESFVVDGVELTGGVNIYNASGVVLRNLTVTGTNYYAVWLDENAFATVESGTYTAGKVALFNAYTATELTVTGGTFNTNGTPVFGTSGGTLSVSGGTFDAAVDAAYCAAGYEPFDNGDGTYTVAATVKPVEVWTAYSGSSVASYATLSEAAANLGDYKWIVVTGDYTMSEDFTIPANVYLDVASGATLTVASGATLTIAENAKRLGIRAGATVVCDGTISLALSGYHPTSNAYAYITLFNGGVFDTTKVTVPEGCNLSVSGTAYFAVDIATAALKIDRADGSVSYYSDALTGNLDFKNATKMTLLKDVTAQCVIDGSKGIISPFVIDLGGHTLSGKSTATSSVLTISNLTATITNGTVKYTSTSTKAFALSLSTASAVTVESDATLDGGSNIGVNLANGELTIKGEVRSNGAYAIAGNGSTSGVTVLTVASGAQISAPNGCAIYHPHNGTVNITGGTITGKLGVQMCAGALTVSGNPVITASGSDETAGKTGDGAIFDGAAVSIVNRGYPGGTPTATISGGTFTAADGVDAVRAYAWTNDAVADWTDVGTSVSISGGTYSTEPKAGYIAEGYASVANADGTYTVVAEASSTVIDTAENLTTEVKLDDLASNSAIDHEAGATYKVVVSAAPAADVAAANEKISASSDTNTNKAIFDISVVKTDSEGTSTDISSAITDQKVTLTLEEAPAADTTVRVYHVTGDTVEEITPVTVSGNTVSFTAPSFSTYAVTYSTGAQEARFGKALAIVNKPTTEYSGGTYYPVDIYCGIDTLQYKEVGFEYRLVVTGANATTASGSKSTTVVYTKMNVTTTAGETKTYTPGDLNATYMYGQQFLFDTAKYTSAEVTLIVKPYAVSLDGSMTYYSDEITLTEDVCAANGTHLFKDGQ